MGSPRKGNTYHAAERLREIVQQKAPVDWEYVMLGDINMAQCRGCFTCFYKGEEFCPIDDDASGLEQRMKDADGVILATPVYGLQVSGLMKTFIDRHSYIFHRPRFFRQKALILTSTGAVGTKDVHKYLDMVARIWGFDVSVKAGILSHPRMGPVSPYRAQQNERILESAAGVFISALQRGTRSRPGLVDVIMFHVGRAAPVELGESGNPADLNYWTDQGWLQKERRYYVDVPVNPAYTALGKLVERVMRWQIRRGRLGSG